MVRRITIACGFLTAATLFVLTWQEQTLSESRFWGHGTQQVTVIPDKPMFRPPVKPLPAPPLRAMPPAPQPKPLHQAPTHRGM